VPNVVYGYTTDFVNIRRDPRGFANWDPGDGLVSPWREGDKLYLFASKYVHRMDLPVQDTYTISGTVTSGGQPMEGVEVTANGHSDTTNADGEYTITGLAADTYTVTPTLAEYTFTPSDDEVTLTAGAPEATGVDFVGTEKTYSISGDVQDDGSNPLAGVEVTADGQTDTTDASGQYQIAGLVAGTYTVTASKTGYAFTPTEHNDVEVNETVGDATDIDFTGEPTYSISGTVLTDAGDPNSGLEGVEVTAGSQSGTTNADGDYTISGLVAGIYTVTPELAEYTFAPIPPTPDPPDITVGPDATDVDFEATRKTYYIEGIVRGENRDPIDGATVSADGGTDTTDGSGYYQITGLISGTYTVTVSDVAEYTFTPQDATVNETVGNATADFQGTPKTYSIRGTVTNAVDPLPGVQVTADGESDTTDVDGIYEISGLLAGSYTVTPELAEYTFAPPEQTGVEVNETVGDAENIDFVGTRKTYYIEGTVTDENSDPIDGATVSADGGTDTTDGSGYYQITGLISGTYTVTVSDVAEYTFTPQDATVNETVGNATVDFQGMPKTYSIRGTVTNAGDPLPGVQATADGESDTTDVDGTYEISGLLAGTYTVTPDLAEYTFDPPEQTGVEVNETVGDAEDVDFVGTQKTYTISGTVTNEQEEPMEGVELSAGGKSTTTGPDGTYTLEELIAGTYSVKPSFSEYDFTPSPMNVTVNENDGPAADVNFVGSPKQYTISGTILDWEGNAMSGVEVGANGHSATTDTSGEYSIAGPVAGTYTVIPEQADRGFVPGSQEVTVNEDVGDASDIDFTGYPAYTTQLPAGLSLVGVPCQPVTDDLSEVFATDEVVRWAPDLEPPGYLGLGDPGARSLLALEAGKGYFVRHTTPEEISVLGITVPTHVTFELPLGSNWGWNLVANPFPQTLPFSNLMIGASHILPYGFLYDTATGSYQVVTDRVGVNITRNSLEPWEGMWVRALQSPATLFIHPPGPAAAEAESVVRAADLGPRGWAIPVTARVGDRADLSSVCGVSGNQAAYQIDNPPAVADAVDLYLVTEEGRHLAHDIRPAGVGQTTWDFIVCTDIPDSEVQVRLSDLSAVPHDLTVLLTDLDAQRTVYARTVPLYTFHSSAEGATVRHFRLQVQPKSDAGLVISSAAVHRAPAGLTVAYTVSQSCAMTIEITNISGRSINRVCSAQPVAAGVNTTTWSLRSQEGTQVPSGRYLICLQAVAANGQSVTRIVSTQIVR